MRTIDPVLKRRLQLLFDAGIALAAYHLPLDAHPELGNNALLARALGATDLAPFALHHGQPIGFIATLPGGGESDAPPDAPGNAAGDAPTDGIPAEDLFARVHTLTEREPLVFDAGPPRVRRLAIVSGGGSDYTADAAAAGADALLTGEPTERSMAQARESRRAPHRRRAPRDRDVRRQAPRRAPRRALRPSPRVPRRAQPRLTPRGSR